tara:strand:+ start:5258 stop:5551 length:294 start_codon:yes stop_codon:yes gene_type:complete
MDILSKFGSFLLRLIPGDNGLSYIVSEASEDYFLLESSTKKPKWDRSDFNTRIIEFARGKYRRGERPTFLYSWGKRKDRKEYDYWFKNIIHMLEEFD